MFLLNLIIHIHCKHQLWTLKLCLCVKSKAIPMLGFSVMMLLTLAVLYKGNWFIVFFTVIIYAITQYNCSDMTWCIISKMTLVSCRYEVDVCFKVCIVSTCWSEFCHWGHNREVGNNLVQTGWKQRRTMTVFVMSQMQFYIIFYFLNTWPPFSKALLGSMYISFVFTLLLKVVGRKEHWELDVLEKTSCSCNG